MDHFDVVIVGAGLSGIGMAYHLQSECPGRTYAILEGRGALGGTWDLFRYPGVRSDSDMHTLGYSFRPWTAHKAIADGPAILEYLQATAREFGIDRHIRYDSLVTHAEWSSTDSAWTLTVTHRDAAPPTTITCNYLKMCTGYYSYTTPHAPDFVGREHFSGTVVHPQFWPDDLDVSHKRVVIIGSGATAMTLVPALARDAAHVTMLQRSPTYVVSRPDVDKFANALQKYLPSGVAYRTVRAKNVLAQQFFYKQTRTRPDKIKRLLVDGVRKELGDGYDVERHFTPQYNPWDQRLCLVPNNDLFGAIRSGKASVVTDTISAFTEHGIELDSGGHIDADIIVTATGLELERPGNLDVVVDGTDVNLADTWSYKGHAFSDVPNLSWTFGYINASWTLRSDLVAQYVCRTLNHMRAVGATRCTPRLRESDVGMTPRPWVDRFPAGYIQRGMHLWPKQGDHEPWINPQLFGPDKATFRKSLVDDGVMQFERTQTSTHKQSTAQRSAGARKRSFNS